jgi:hypothetical protein
MTTPERRRCERPGCDRLRAAVGVLCAEHRAESPPRPYHRYDGGPTRHCPRCDQDKPISDFPGRQSGRPRSTCKPCRAATNRAYKARHHDELLARRRAGYPEPRTHGWRLHRHEWSVEQEDRT